MLTTNKTAPGEFEVFWNGKKTAWTIFNGSHGYVGSGASNTYGVTNGKQTVKVGSLASCKKLLAGRLSGTT